MQIITKYKNGTNKSRYTIPQVGAGMHIKEKKGKEGNLKCDTATKKYEKKHQLQMEKETLKRKCRMLINICNMMGSWFTIFSRC